MRAAVMDARLEAVAGQPVLATRTPVWRERTLEKFAVFAGVIIAPVDTPQVALQSRESAQVAAEHNLWMAGASTTIHPGGGAQLYPAPPGVLAGSIPLTNAYVGLGVNYVPQQAWQGPFMAAVYDRPLTAIEARMVAHRLAGLL